MKRAVMVLGGIMMGLGQFALVGVGLGGTALATPLCVDAGSSGLTAAVVASASGQVITSVVDATGCDVGIYIGPNVHNVIVNNATVENATYHGILAQDTYGIIVQNSTVSNNAAGGESESFPETKAIQFSGVSDGMIRNNIVVDNGGGGIAVVDDGELGTGTPNSGNLSGGNNNKVVGNDVENNRNGCGIVVASYNPGGGVSGNVVVSNYVVGNPAGIVIAADPPGTSVANNSVMLNTVWGNLGVADIVVHSNAPNDNVNNTRVLFNKVGSFDSGDPGIGIIVGAEAPGAVLTGTSVVGNHITNEFIGIATKGVVNVWPIATTYDNVINPIGPEPVSGP